jgi:virulence factor Mce-like protein
MPYVADNTGRELPTATFARRGVVAFALVAVAVALLLMQYKGAFRSTFPVHAEVLDVGDGITAGADVKLRGVLVGSVRDVHLSTAAGRPVTHMIDLDLRPDEAAGIPAGVTARVVPTNTFGSPGVELLDPTDQAGMGRSLARNGTILGDTSSATLQLQTVFSELSRVLGAIHPAELNVALTNIAQSLQGRGGKINQLIAGSDTYLTALNAQSPIFSNDLRLLGTDLQVLHDTAPQLLDAVDNAVVTSKTIVDKRDRLVAALTGANTTAGDVDDFLSDNNNRIINVVHDGRGIAGVLADEKGEVTRSLGSVGQGGGLLLKALGGGVIHLEGTLTPFRPYTSADCPRYPGLSGPNCGKPAGDKEFGPLSVGPAIPPLPGLPHSQPKPKNPNTFTPKPAKGQDARGQDKDQGGLPGLFGMFQPSGFAGGAAGPVGSPAEARTIARLLGTPSTGAAGELLLGPIVRGRTVVVGA